MKKLVFSVYVVIMIVYVNCFIIFAEEGNWGGNIEKWVVKQASSLAIAAIVVIIVPLIFKKAWSGLIGTIFASGVALYFVNYPESLMTIGTMLYKIVFS